MFINFIYKNEPVKVPYTLIKVIIQYDEKQSKLKSRLKLDDNISKYRKTLRTGHIKRQWQKR